MAGCEIVYIKKGSKITEKGMAIECLGPSGDSLESNECSQVLRVTLGEFDALFTGDVEGKGEEELVGVLEEKKGNYEVLKVAHHGSKNSTGTKFLEQMHPRAAVISCGVGNRYGHPHRELLERLQAENTEIIKTADCGAVFVRAGEDWVEISCSMSFQAGEIMIE